MQRRLTKGDRLLGDGVLGACLNIGLEQFRKLMVGNMLLFCVDRPAEYRIA